MLDHRTASSNRNDVDTGDAVWPATGLKRRWNPNLESLIDQRRNDLLGFSSQPVATPSPNPSGDERAVAAVVLAETGSAGPVEGVSAV